MVAAGAEAFFSAERDSVGIEQIAEELPARGGLEALDAQLLRHHIHRSTGRHGAGNARQTACIGRHEGGVGGEDRQAVTGIHKASLAQDHVAIAISVASGTETVVVALQEQIGQLMGCLLYTSPSPRDVEESRMPSSA